MSSAQRCQAWIDLGGGWGPESLLVPPAQDMHTGLRDTVLSRAPTPFSPGPHQLPELCSPSVSSELVTCSVLVCFELPSH